MDEKRARRTAYNEPLPLKNTALGVICVINGFALNNLMFDYQPLVAMLPTAGSGATDGW